MSGIPNYTFDQFRFLLRLTLFVFKADLAVVKGIIGFDGRGDACGCICGSGLSSGSGSVSTDGSTSSGASSSSDAQTLAASTVPFPFWGVWMLSNKLPGKEIKTV